jgi:hypothetical protein
MNRALTGESLQRRLSLERKRTYENTIENIDLVLKGHDRSPTATPLSHPPNSYAGRGLHRSPSVTRRLSQIAPDIRVREPTNTVGGGRLRGGQVTGKASAAHQKVRQRYPSPSVPRVVPQSVKGTRTSTTGRGSGG